MRQEHDETVIGPYSFCERYCLGQGAFGKVYKGSRITDGLEVAIKQIDISYAQDKTVHNEIALLSKLQHPNVVRYYDAIRTHNNFYIVTQYCSGGDVSDQLGSSDEQEQLSEQAALEMFFQVAQGFEYLRKHNIMHRDLKPANILIHKGQYKIADFGLAKLENLGSSVMSQSFVGSPMYMSPQVLSRNFYTYKCDVWGLGIIFYELLFGHLPWKTTDTNHLLFKIMETPCPYADSVRQISETSRVILDGTLKYLEKERLGWTDLLASRKKRKKIFGQEPRNNEPPLLRASSQPTPKVSPLEYDFDTFDYNSVQNDLMTYERQILKHVYNQFYSVKMQILRVTSRECCEALILTCSCYLKAGTPKKRNIWHHLEEFYDCCSMFLKLATNRMSEYMIQLEELKQARDILVLLELVHNLITMKSNSLEEYTKVFSCSNVYSNNINQYVASVLSKINRFAS